MSLLHNHYTSTGQEANDLLANMFITEIPPDHQRPTPRRRHSPATSQKLIRSYDHSAPTSPVMSRRNSSSSISSTKSEPAWESELNRRKSSVASTKTNDSAKSLRSFFKKGDKKEKKKDSDQVVLTSKHAAAVKTKMMMDPEYRKMMEKKGGKKTKTAGVQGTEKTSHLTAAEQEMRHPHSGNPTHHSALDMPALTRIVSGDEEDTEIDNFERIRREWSGGKGPEMHRIEESLSSHGNSPAASAPVSPVGSPMVSRESSPNRSSYRDSYRDIRPILPKSKNSWGGGYRRNERGQWTKNHSGTSSPIPRANPPPNPDLLAQSLAEKLHTKG